MFFNVKWGESCDPLLVPKIDPFQWEKIETGSLYLMPSTSFLPNLGARGDPAGLIPTVDTPVAPTLWLLASVAAYQRFKQPPC